MRNIPGYLQFYLFLCIDAQDEVSLDSPADELQQNHTNLVVNHSEGATLDTTPVVDKPSANNNATNKTETGRISPKLTVIHNHNKTEEEVLYLFSLGYMHTF